MLKTISIIGIAASLILLYNSGSLPLGKWKEGDSIAQVLQPQNDIRLKRQGLLHWQHIQDPTKAQAGDTIFAGANSTTNIVLKGGSEIGLRPNSLIIMQKDFLELEMGSMDINLKPNEGIKALKINGQLIPLKKAGSLRAVKDGKNTKVEFTPQGGGEVEELMVVAPVVTPTPAPTPAPVPEVLPAPLPEVTAPAVEAPRPTPVKKTPVVRRPKPKVQEPVMSVEPEPTPELLPVMSEIPAKKKDSGIKLYFFGSKTSQTHDVTVKGGGQTFSEKYNLDGVNVEGRFESQKMLKKPIAISLDYTSSSGSDAKYAGGSVGLEMILKAKNPKLQNFEFLPGFYYRRYTLELDNFIPTTSSTKVGSESAQFSFLTRWEKNFAETWTAELWPQIKVHYKEDLLMDYILMGAVGKNTKIGRFSLYSKYIANNDNMSTKEGDSAKGDVKTTDFRLGLMYVLDFDRLPAAEPVRSEEKPRKKYGWDTYVFASQARQSHEVIVKGQGQKFSQDYKVDAINVEARFESQKMLKKPIAISVSHTSGSGSKAKYSGNEVGLEMIFKLKNPKWADFSFLPGFYFRQYSMELEDFIPGAAATKLASSSGQFSFLTRWEKNFAGTWTAELWPQIKIHYKEDLLLDYILLGAIGKNTKIGRFSVYSKFIANKDNLSTKEGDSAKGDVITQDLRMGLMYRFDF